MTPFQRILACFLNVLRWEWSAHRSLWLALLVGIPAAGALWAVLTNEPVLPRLLDAFLLLEALAGLALFLGVRAVAQTVGKGTPEEDAVGTLMMVTAGVFTTATSVTLFVRTLV